MAAQADFEGVPQGLPKVFEFPPVPLGAIGWWRHDGAIPVDVIGTAAIAIAEQARRQMTDRVAVIAIAVNLDRGHGTDRIDKGLIADSGRAKAVDHTRSELDRGKERQRCPSE